MQSLPLRWACFRRLEALLLLTVFLCAGSSLPSLDALLYHSSAPVDRSQVHIEPAGGCLSHSDHCSLGRSASGSAAVAALGSAARIEPVSGSTHRSVSPAQPACADRSAIPQPRAPPLFRIV